jgi:hypothetical protein
MPKLSGIFEQFRYIDQIPSSDILKWIQNKVETHNLENFIANRIIYPQTVPTTKLELEIDMAIFREAVKRQTDVFYSLSKKRILIPEQFETRFANTENLVKCLVQALSLDGVTQIYFKREISNDLIGSVVSLSVLPQVPVINVSINNQVLGVKNWHVNILPFRDKHLIVKIEGFPEYVASGGSLGLILDFMHNPKLPETT